MYDMGKNVQENMRLFDFINGSNNIIRKIKSGAIDTFSKL